MHIVLAPNSFRDGPDAATVAAAMAKGVYRALPNTRVTLLPLADGGDGTLAALTQGEGKCLHTKIVRGPHGRPVAARFATSIDGTTAFIEMAEASGLRLIAAPDRDPFHFSTYGTGELIRAALDLGVTRILLGAGGSGTIDVGAGALAALGAVFLNATGDSLGPTPADLVDLVDIDLVGLDPRLLETEIIVLSDVSTPLGSNAAVYGRQKGVRTETAALLDQVVLVLSMIAHRRGYNILASPWQGAGGGLAGAMVAFAGAHAVGGAEYIARRAGLPEQLRYADLLLTGEGQFDITSFHGKLPTVITSMAVECGIPSVIIAGCVAQEALELLPETVACFSSSLGPGTLEVALSVAVEHITILTEQVVRLHTAVQKDTRSMVNPKITTKKQREVE